MDKIICVGKNYPDHVKEMGGNPQPSEPPVLFLKPPSVVVTAAKWGEKIAAAFMAGAEEIHHECEIVVRLAAGGFRISEREAEAAIESVTLGLDMTRRDIQAELKKGGKPWTISKVFPHAAIVGPWIRLQDFPDYLQRPFSFSLNQTLRQQSSGEKMSWSPARCISYASQFFPLCAGDCLFTGTPAGVGPVRVGDIGTLAWGPWSYQVEWRNGQ